MSPRSSRGPLAIFFVFAACISLYLLYIITTRTRQTRYKDNEGAANLDLAITQRRQRVAVASLFGFHHDVYMSVAWSLARAMNRSSTGSVEVYADVPFAFGFQNVVDDLGLYRHDYRHPDELIPTLQNDPDGIDMLIFGTCEIDLRVDWAKDLLSIWDSRPYDRKFKLICIVHNVKDTSWQPAITEWARRGAIRIITIGEHVAHAFRESFNTLADSPDPSISSAGYENIQIDVHVPILPLRNLPERPSSRPLSKAVIQGSFSMDRRDYFHIFRELNDSLHEDPTSWGYQPLGEDQESFVVDATLSTPPFQLFALGSGDLKIPIELKNVVEVRTGLGYLEFYDIMSQMDICVPAFGNPSYFQDQASSTFAMAIQCNVPILVTQRTRNSYAYADDDRAVITRPSALREVAALKVLRTGDASSFLNTPMPHISATMRSNPFLGDSIERMLHQGWRRSERELDTFKIRLWKRNDDLAYRLLNDL